MDDDDDFLSELGIKGSKPTPTSTIKTLSTQSTPKVSAAPINVRSGSNPAYLDTSDVTKKKKKPGQVARKDSEQQDDLKSWLSASPREPSALAAKGGKPSADTPRALAEDDTEFKPMSSEERFDSYATAFDLDDEDGLAMNLAEDNPFLKVAKANMKGEAATRFIASWRQHCGGNLGDAKMTKRTVSFLSALVLYHDPKLWAHVSSHKFDFVCPALFEFYAPSDSKWKPIMELWDASVVNALPGFETPAQGSIFYALALCICNRERLMTASSDSEVRSMCDEIRASTHPVAAIIVGSRAAKFTAEYFLRLVGETELDWTEYDHMLLGESKRAPASPPPSSNRSSLQRQATAPKKEEPAKPPVPATAAAGSATTATTSTWMGSMSSWTKGASAASLSAGFSTFTQKMSEALQGNIDDDEAPAQPRLARRRTVSESRHLFVVEYPGTRRLGLQLGQTATGLSVTGFDKSSATPGEAESEGTVQIGDAMHSVNWVSVSFLPPTIAGKVIAKQERPLHITFSTAHPQGRTKLPAGLSLEARSMQQALLKSRLMLFYSRYGHSKLDEVSSILKLYAKHERALVRGLFCKYGEPVPGDCAFSSELVLISAAEALSGGLTRLSNDEEDPDDLIFVDVRTPEERADTGVFPAAFSLTFDEKDERVMKNIQKGISRRSPMTKVCLIASGNHRMYMLVDPARAQEEKNKELERCLKAATKLSQAGLHFICAVRGGFAECYREAKLRVASFTADTLSDCGHGLLHRACEAYSMLNLKDTESLGHFCVGYFSDFKEPMPVPQVAAESDPATNGATIGDPASRVLSHDVIQQNLQAAFKELVPTTTSFAAMPSLSSTVGLFKQSSTGRLDTATPAGGKPGAPTEAEKKAAFQTQQHTSADIFTIEDD